MPRKPMNLDGQRFGSLTVEHITEQRNSYGSLLYLCRCDCGNTRLATAANLKRGEITRCETCQGKSHMKNLAGQRFGRLTAIKPVDAPTAKRTTYKWLCVCDCGNVSTVSANALTTGKTKSCGCAQTEAVKNLYVGDTAPCKLNEKENPRKTNTSGRTGVWFDQSKQLWCAELMFRGKKHFLGRYALFEDAVKAREKAEEKYFGKFLKKHAKKQSAEQKTNNPLPDAKAKRYVGKTFGGLRVLGMIEKQPRLASKFLCKCTTCGKLIIRKEGTLRRPPSSCGCVKKSIARGSRTEIRTCQVCGKTFSTYATQDKKFCSRECYEQYRKSEQTNEKLWRIKSPGGQTYEIENLYRWARENWKLIDPETTDIERTIYNFANGLYNAKRSVERPNEKFRSKAYQYKGWTVIFDKEESQP